MTAKEIISILENSELSVSAFAYCAYSEGIPNDFKFSKEDLNWREEEKEWLDSLGIGEIEEVEQYGGEGQGDTWYSVKYFPKHDVYIRTDGFYSSYNGTDFYDGYGEEVKPVQKTIVVYE